jgi:DNA repair protein RadC
VPASSGRVFLVEGKMEKTLEEIIDEIDREKRSSPSKLKDTSPEEKKEELQKDEVEIPIEQLKLIKVGSVRYKLPKPPFISPHHSIAMFQVFFEGADIEIAAAICLNSQNEFMSLVPVAYGTVDHVHVSRREFFKRVLAQYNAASFIVAHNHPSGNPKPSQEDFDMLVDLRDEGKRLDCFMNDFLIIGKNGTYYSHRELHYGKETV